MPPTPSSAGFFGFVGADGDVGDLLFDDGDEMLGGGELDLQLDVGEGGGEFLDRFGEVEAEEVLRGGNDEVGGELGAAFVEETFEGVDGLDVGLDDVEEESAFGGEFDGAAFAAKERAAEHAFESAELFPDGGGGESEFACGDGEVSFAGGEAEAAQLRELHVFVAVGTSHAGGSPQEGMRNRPRVHDSGWGRGVPNPGLRKSREESLTLSNSRLGGVGGCEEREEDILSRELLRDFGRIDFGEGKKRDGRSGSDYGVGDDQA